MQPCLLVSFCLLLAALPGRAQEAAAGAPAEVTRLPRLAILAFKAAPGCWEGWRAGGWGTSLETLSDQLRDLLSTELMAQAPGRIRLVERERLADLRKELDLQQSGEVDVRTVRKMGKLLGASHVLVGKVTRFAYTAARAGVDLTGTGVRELSFTGRLDLRLLEVETGEVLETFREEGRVASTQVRFLGAGEDFAYDGELVSRVFEPVAARLAPKIVAATAEARD